MHELDALRTRIDTIDEQIIRLLADRFGVTEEVGLLKKRNQLQAVDPQREAAQAERFRAMADAHQLDPNLVQHIFACVIQEVVSRHRALSDTAEDDDMAALVPPEMRSECQRSDVRRLDSMTDSADQIFRHGVRQGLAKLDSQIEGVLRSLVSHNYPPEVFALSFEVFSDGFTSGFPVRAFFMDRSNTEHFVWDGEQAKYPSPVDPGLIDTNHVYAEELEEALEENSPESDPWSIATEELIQWFASHWQRGGGANFPLVATIAAHDSSEEFNLKSGRWQSSYAEFDA